MSHPGRGLVDAGLADLELMAQALARGNARQLDASTLQKLGLGHLAAAFEIWPAWPRRRPRCCSKR